MLKRRKSNASTLLVETGTSLLRGYGRSWRNPHAVGGIESDPSPDLCTNLASQPNTVGMARLIPVRRMWLSGRTLDVDNDVPDIDRR